MSLYPENPAGQVYQVTSQDTFASAGAPLSVVGSGGGGPVVIPENLVVSTLTAADFVSTVALEGVSTINGAPYATGGGVPANLVVSTLVARDTISTGVFKATGGGAGVELGMTLGTKPNFTTESLLLAFNSVGQENPDQGQLAILKSNGLKSVSKPSALGGLGVYSFSTILGSYQPLGASDIYIFQAGIDNYDTQAFMLEAKNSPVSSLNIQAPNVNISSLIGVSSINGVAYTGGGGGPVPANLTVSSLTAADTVTASLLLLNGAEEVAIEVGADAGLGGSSQYIAFNSPSQDTADAGQLAIFKSVTTSVSNPSGAAGLAIYAVSTSLGSYQRLACSDIYIVESAANNDDGRLAFALEAVNNPVSSLNIQAPNVHFSSLIGISSINGVNWAVLSTLAAGA